MQRVEERHEGGHLGGLEVLAVGGHVAIALEHLAHELVVGEPRHNAGEVRTAFPARPRQGVTVAALLLLQEGGADEFERRMLKNKLIR